MSIKDDNRYKIDQKIVDEMRFSRKAGETYQAIADTWGVSYSTALYWCNTEQRKKQRAKNAKRTKTDKELKASITRDMAKRKEAFRIDERAKLRHEIQAAVDEKRCNRQSVRGIDIDSAKKLLKSGKLKRPNAKIQ